MKYEGFLVLLLSLETFLFGCGHESNSIGTDSDTDTDTDADTDTDSDTISDAGPTSEACGDFAVEVAYLGETEIVDLSGLETYSFDGRELISLQKIVEQTDFDLGNTEYIGFNFEGCDGSMPQDSTFCKPIVPIGYVYVTIEGNGLEVSTLDLIWWEEHEFPDCMFIEQVGIIYIENGA